MRQLTFAGFLKQYVAGLSKAGGGLYKMAHEAATSNARLREPLLLYALYSDKLPVLMKATKSKELMAEYTTVLSSKSPAEFCAALESGDKSIPTEYQKVWQSYMSVRNTPKRDAHTKNLMRNKVLRLQSQAGVSTYRMYKDLGLNGGNLNAWLKSGDDRKVSLATARRVVSYMETYITK